MSCAAVWAQMKFESVSSDVPMIINKITKAHLTYDSYKLVYFADLKPFYNLRNGIKMAIDGIKRTHHRLNKPMFTSAGGQLEHQLELLYADEERLMSHRAKRFILCEFCGKVNHFLFGVMDSETAKKYDEAINNLHNTTISDREIIRNQSAVFETALHFNKNVFLRFEEEINQLNKNADNITAELRNMQIAMTEQSLIQITQLLFAEYYRVYGQIRRALSDARDGKMGELIPKYQMANDLKSLSQSLKATQSLPIDPDHEDVFHIFKFTQIKSTLFARKILVEVTLPVTEREQHFLYKATPIPMQIGEHYWITSPLSNYFLLNWDRTKYIPMSQQQLDNGKMLSTGEIMYRPTVTTLLNSNAICEWQILLGGQNLHTACHFEPFIKRNALISVYADDILFLMAEKNTTLYEICHDSDIEQRMVRGRLTIELDPNCTFKTENFMIRPHNTIGTITAKILMPTIRLDSQLTTMMNTNIFNGPEINKTRDELCIIRNSAELEQLMDTTKELVTKAHQEVKFDEIHYDTSTTSIFTSIIGSFSFFAIIMAIVPMILCKCNLFGWFLNLLIRKSTAAQVETDGTITIEMPKILAKRLNRENINVNN